MYKHKNGITLKKLEREDLELLKELKNESWFGTHNITFVNSIDQEKWFNSLDSNKNLILVAYKGEEKVGLYKILNIDWMNRRYDSGYDIFENHRGNKLAFPVLEAGIDFGFEILNINRIDTEVLENNIASMKTILKVGFTKEGIKRKCIYKCGKYLDSIFLGLCKDDWEKLERIKEYDGLCNLSYKPKNQ